MSKDWHENISDDYRQESRKWFDEAFKNVDPDKFMAGARRTKSNAVARYTEMGKYVNGDPRQGELNPEYLARAEATKKLREQLKTYSGSTEIASDLIYQLKKEADAEGRDFTSAARDKVEQMKGQYVEGFEPDALPVVLKPEPKRSLAGRFVHWLWKKGFPVGRFIRDELSVNEADKL